MSKMVQIRNVPDELHRTLRVRAAQSGRSLSEYLLRELEQIAAVPTHEEMLARLRALTPVRMRTSSAAIIRRERDKR